MTREEAIEKLHWFALDNRDKQIIDTAIEALTSQNLTEPNNACEVDLISRADAIESIVNTGSMVAYHDASESVLFGSAFRQKEIIDIIKALPSADAVPTVIRSKTLMPTKDFKEWAKRIREENPNVIVIPCDAEVVSANAYLVRCKDCLKTIVRPDGEIYCKEFDREEMPKEFYCGFGERREL